MVSLVLKNSICLLSFLLFFSCRVTSHSAKLQEFSASPDIQLADQKTKDQVTFQTVKAADWEVPLKGLLNLEDPKAKELGLTDRAEPISIYFHLIKHPSKGVVMIDSGIAESFTKSKEDMPLSSLVASQMNLEKLKVYHTTKKFLKENSIPLKAVFLTHMHLDHIMGASEIDKEVPIFIGPGESQSKQFMNLFVQGSTDRLMGENPNLQEIEKPKDPDQTMYLDFFGDKSFYVIWVPGHTAGSLAFFVQTKSGKHLVLGDSCHTQIGWNQDIIPGEFTADAQQNRKSLTLLKEIDRKWKADFIYPGHQERILKN